MIGGKGVPPAITRSGMISGRAPREALAIL